MNYMSILISFTSLLLIITSFCHAIVEDYCVADFNLPKGPAGYSCKDPSNITTNDFVFTGLRTHVDFDKVFKASATFASVKEFPGLNGLGLSMVRLDFEVGGVIPVHTHRTSEVIIVIKGKIIAGFIDNDYVAYYKTLYPGDVMIFPESLLHFQVNVGKTRALAYVSLNSANPGFQTTDYALFASNLPSEIVEKIMLLDPQEVKKIKKIIAGDN